MSKNDSETLINIRQLWAKVAKEMLSELMMIKIITKYEVAELADISKHTVTHILKSSTPQVTPLTIRKIVKAHAEHFGYSPDLWMENAGKYKEEFIEQLKG